MNKQMIKDIEKEFDMKLVGPEDPALYTKSELVTDEEIDNVIAVSYIFHGLMTLNGGCGLAANQIGDTRQYFLMNKELVINPIILKQSDKLENGREGCLSFPNQKAWIKRPRIITVEYTDGNKERVTKTLRGDKARVFMHEYDHLQGITIV